MHVDKNADGHVVDQNVDRILGEIAYIPLGGGIRSKCSSWMQFYFIFIFCMSTRHAYLRSRIYEDSSHVFLRTKGSRSWLTFLEDLGFLDLGSCFQRTKGFLGFGSCFQRTKGSRSWLMFSEDLRFLDLGLCFSEDQEFFGLWLMFLENQRFWILAHVFRGPRIFGSWLMFSEDQGFFWTLAHVFRGSKVLDPSSCFQRT